MEAPVQSEYAQDVHPFATDIARELLQRLDGGIDDPHAWIALAERLDCILFPVVNTTVWGEMVMRPGRRPVLIYTTSVPGEMQCRIIAHELAHWMLRGGWPLSLFTPETFGCVNSDHKIACIIEELLFGDIRYAFIK